LKERSENSRGAARSKRNVIEEESEEEEEEARPARKKGFMPKRSFKKKVIEEEEEDEEDDDEEDDEEEEDGDEDDEDYEEEDSRRSGAPGIMISFGSGEEQPDRMVPTRHNMKKESEDVRKFVKLITKPVEDGGIDDQIDEFKRLSADKQKDLIVTLERKSTVNPNSQSMMFKILSMKLSPETQ
jgi:hypothetical protein